MWVETHSYHGRSLQSKDYVTTGIESSPSSILEFVQDTQNVLHRMVSEGDVEGMRLFTLLSKFFIACTSFYSNGFVIYMAIVLSLKVNVFHFNYADIFLQ